MESSKANTSAQGEPRLNSLLECLSAQQQQAVEQTEGSLLILAGPGTGKTRVITAKILELIKSGISAEAVLALTFSRRASHEMEERLSQENSRLIGRVSIQTLHSLCLDLVQQHGFRLGLHRKIQLMSEAQSQLLFHQISHRLPLQPLLKSSHFSPVVSSILSFFEDCKDEGYWPEDVIAWAQNLPEKTEDDKAIKDEWISLGDSYNAFQSYCFDQGYMDFGDCLLSAVRLLEDSPMVRKEMQEQFQAILVDEFQDTNWIQNRLLRLLAGDYTHVAVVGDDDQSIYRFRGASYSSFQFFQDFFPGHQVIELNETYRLPEPIAETATALIQANGENRFKPDKQLNSKAPSSDPVEVWQFGEYEEEAIQVVKQIEELLSEGVSPAEIGILVRAHSHAASLLKLAKQRNLPIESSSHDFLFEQEIVQDVMALFRLLTRPEDNLSFLRLLDSPFLRLEADEIYRLGRWAQDQQKAYIDLLSDLDASPLKHETQEILKSFYQDFQMLYAKANRYSASTLLSIWYGQNSGLKQMLKENSPNLSVLARFHRQLEEWEQLQDQKELRAIFPLLDSISRHDVKLQEEETEVSPSSIRVLTVHASKGLEFEHVFVLSLVNRRFPAQFRSQTWMLPNECRKEKAPDKAAHLEEERRLLYVAITRSKEKLILSTVRKKGTKPSVFLTDDIAKQIQNPKILYWKEFEPEEHASVFQQIPPSPFSRVQSPTKQERQKEKKESLSLSYTQIEKYERCPLSYWFAYELKIPVETPSSLTIGLAVHETLEAFYRRLQQDKLLNKDQFLEIFSEIFTREQKNNPNLSERDLQLGLEKLSNYYDYHSGHFQVPLALEKAFVLPVGPHKVRGKIDRVDERDDGVVIVDYKTGKAKSEDNANDRRHAKESLQLSIYALAAEEVFQWKVNELVLYYVYENTSLHTERAPDQLEQTKEKILTTAQNIQNENFEANPGHHCQWCDFKRVCPSAKR